jgi:poly(hydroxyalkanoate) depolymerase family esterase
MPKAMNKWCFCLLTVLFPYFSGATLNELPFKGKNEGKLKAFFHQPTVNDVDSLSKPLVVVLHGCNQNAKTIYDEAGWEKLSDEFGFYVLCPEQRRLNNGAMCFNWFSGADNSSDKGELSSIVEMINYVFSSYAVDKKRVFVYGVSAGAFMCSALLANHPELFRAGAVLAGGPWYGAQHVNVLKRKTTEELINVLKSRYPNGIAQKPDLLVFHGTKDPVVSPENGRLLFEQWTGFRKSDSLMTTQKDTLQLGKCTVFRQRYVDAECRAEYLQVKDLGHYLVVDPGNGIEQGGKKGLFTLDRDWFSTLYVVKFFGF